MFDGQHRHRCDRPAHDGVRALLAVYFMAGWEVER